mmetsp:Transcript_40235/g.97128  ORF Transcript_40235/g.97128 Transcript_40235/m.97128 type:complete len:1135 (-) Transcript_40235:1806-5210(-)
MNERTMSMSSQTRNRVDEAMESATFVGEQKSASVSAKEDVAASTSPQQSRRVLALRVTMYVMLCLLIAGIIVGSMSLIEKGKQQALEEEVERLSDDVMLILGSFIHCVSTQLSEVSTALTVQYTFNDSNGVAATELGQAAQGFPDITLPFFDERIQAVQPDVDLVFYTPIITSDVASKREWEDYASRKQGWIDEDLQRRGWAPINAEIPYFIHQYTGSIEDQDLNSFDAFAAPVWQFSPPPKDRSIINLDASTFPYTRQMIQESIEKKSTTNEPILSGSFDAEMLLQYAEAMNSTTPRTLVSMTVRKAFSSIDSSDTPEIVGQIFALMSWEKALDEAFEGANMDLQVDVKESCGYGFSFFLQGGKIVHLPSGGTSSFVLSDTQVLRTLDHLESCQYTFTIRPTEGTEVQVVPFISINATLSACFIVLFLMVVFHLHNRLSQGREAKLFATAQSSAAMVSSLFPSAVQSRLMAEVESKKQDNHRLMLERSGSMNFNAKELYDSKPIADFFPEATVMFADIAGFTAWSSMREPTQVFTLLEALYHNFDEIARRRKVFKVETIGDCYVAVVGLPEPCLGHAVVMSRFANDCLMKMKMVVKSLEVSLGPDTADLGLRVGLHSGPITAGVLRGDKARFQLFGDTVNTCSRIETTGKRDKIHISKETADLLNDAGKEHWIEQREDKVTAKGKGELTTFWLRVTRGKKDATAGIAMSASLSTLLSMSSRSGGDEISERHNRLVDWITNELAVLLRVVEMTRLASAPTTKKASDETVASLERASLASTMNTTPLKEIKEIIHLPPFDPSVRDLPGLGEMDFTLSLEVLIELRDFVNNIAMMYRENPFHNFEHASHVTMSVVKLLTRIVAPQLYSNGEEDIEHLHHKTYGIASDPLTQFTMVLSALVHDVDHPGVSNSQLVTEKTALAELYHNKSVAEQNSIDKTWILLMEGDYQHLRKAIYKTEDEFVRFRSVLVNTVMATDIMDKELSAARKARWEIAFNAELNEDPVTASNRKATIVLEHLIQASDVAHTMQHWHIYRRWNERLYNEMHKAFDNNRGASNPTDGWYQGELGFYDFYIIPLAKKLKDCGVFGVSSDEYLNYAQQNRREWELNGKAVVGSMKPSEKTDTETFPPPLPWSHLE